MQDSLNSYEGKVGFVHSPTAMAEAKKPVARLQRVLRKLRLSAIANRANRFISNEISATAALLYVKPPAGRRASVVNALAVAAALTAPAAVAYDRALIAQDTYNADAQGASSFRHSPLGLSGLPFKSVYAVGKVRGTGPCAQLIAAEVVPMQGGGTYVYSAADVDDQNIVRQWLTNKRVVTVGQCAGAVAVPARVPVISASTAKPHKAKAPRF